MKKYLFRTQVLLLFIFTYSFCKKNDILLSVKKNQLTGSTFEQSVLKKTDDDEFTLMGYNHDQKLVIIKYNSLSDEIDLKTVDVPSSFYFAVSNFLVNNDGYIITSKKHITKINNNLEVEWIKEPISPINQFGNSLVSDDWGGFWLNGELNEEIIDYESINPPCLLNISNDGTISIIEKYVLDNYTIGYSLKGIYKSIDKESLVLSFYEAYMWGYGYRLFNVNKDGSIIWSSDIGGPFVLVDNRSYFIMQKLWTEGPDQPSRYFSAILDKDGNNINYKIYEEAPYSKSYTTLNFLIDQGDEKIALVTKQNYQLNFYDNEGVLTKTSSLAGIFPENSIKGFHSTSTDYAFYVINNNGSWLYLIPKNQF